ncbi:hypothetical protein N199_05935 [Helicobacter pylori UM038]|uniref:Uncharacterized protein n=1 Tax=Helicobacter pylori UM038 TaxID=1352343 RepID=A0AAV3JRP3_HELPX|nr:hypothetical protein N199_05935 [Helicobacter pylori UM038]
MDCVFRHARYGLFLYTKLLWILADMSDGLIQSLCDVVLLKNDELFIPILSNAS